MLDEFIPLGKQSEEKIEAKLREIEEDSQSHKGLESRRHQPWLYTHHQYGFIAPFEPGEERYHPIRSATNLPANTSLIGQRLNIRLDQLHIYKYPAPLVTFGPNVHNILFTFEARNQVGNGNEEPVAFNQLYKAYAGQDVAVTGQPIFIGLSVGSNGVNFICRTVNIANSTDLELVSIFNSESIMAGLNLLTIAQPALAPLMTIARGLCLSLASRRQNVPVQEVRLGLDFETGASGARLAVGSYIVAQTEQPNDIAWSDWVYDADNGAVMRAPESLAEGEWPYPLPFNTFIFRISRYAE